MTSFKKTQIKNFTKANSKVNPDTNYWKQYELPITVREFTAVDYIDVSPVEPHYIAVTTGPKVDLYNQQTGQIWYSLTRFQKSAYGANFRNDGQLLIAGTEEASVKLFNYKQKQILRIFKGHSGPVHRARFIHGKAQVASFSDDKTVVLWDIPEEKKLCSMESHTDFIRAGCTSPVSEHIVISGSYDHMIKMWDTRTGSSVLNVSHGAPVEALLCYSSGSIFASAGGTEVKIWDAVAGKLLTTLSHHHKTITCLCMAQNGRRLLSGAIDRHVKVYDIDNYSVKYSLDYSDPVLAYKVTPGDSSLVCGMISGGAGLLSFQQRKIGVDPERPTKKISAPVKPVQDFTVLPGDEVVTQNSRDQIRKYDVMLKKFQFSKALDLVMMESVTNKHPHITVSIIWELLRRKSLSQALAGREMKTLMPIFKFVLRNFKNPNFKEVLLEVANVLIDVYEDSVAEMPRLLKMFQLLKEEVESEMLLTREYIDLMGAVEMFLSVSRNNEHASDEVVSAAALAQRALPPSIMNVSEQARTQEIVVDLED